MVCWSMESIVEEDAELEEVAVEYEDVEAKKYGAQVPLKDPLIPLLRTPCTKPNSDGHFGPFSPPLPTAIPSHDYACHPASLLGVHTQFFFLHILV